MKCLIFCGSDPLRAVDAYNKWAEGKMLGRDVIIHSHVIPEHKELISTLAIVVFFDENRHPDWVGKQ